LAVILEQPFGVIDAVELPQTLEEVGLPAQQLTADQPRRPAQRLPAEMLAVEHLLRLDELAVKQGGRQPRRQNRVLNVEEPVIATCQAPGVGRPALGAGIGRVDADIHHLGHVEAPLPHGVEARFVPVGIGDDVDRDIDAERAGEFQRLHITAQRGALAIEAQPLFIQGFDTEEHVLEADRFPPAKDIAVAQQNVAARFQIVPLLDARSRHGIGNGKPMSLLDESDIVDDEDARLADGLQILDDPLDAAQAVAAAVEGPGAAEGAQGQPRENSMEAQGSRGPRKYFRRRRSRCRAGWRSSRLSAKTGGGPAPSRPTSPGTRATAPGPCPTASSSGAIPDSPSPFSTQSLAPAPSARIASATKDALCPPTHTKQRGSSSLVSLARSMTSGTFAR